MDRIAKFNKKFQSVLKGNPYQGKDKRILELETQVKKLEHKISELEAALKEAAIYRSNKYFSFPYYVCE